MKIESTAFGHLKPIPKKYSCEGSDVSPPLTFSDIPKEAKTLAIIMDDPDAPVGTFDHWIAWNIPASIKSFPEGTHAPKEGINGFRRTGYGGPCPPPGKPHRYFFKVYALDSVLDLQAGATKGQLEASMKGHVLSHGELVGTYQR